MLSLTSCFRAALTASLVFTSSLSLAQAYPSKPIEWVVPYAPGGGTDTVARSLGQAMGTLLGQSMVIVNKPGAGTLAANPFIYSKLTYNAEKDFAPVGLTVRFPMILVVNPSVPANNLKELLAWIKTQNSGVSYATPGAGSPHHLTTELFREMASINLSHIPYRGAAPAVQDVVAGQVPMMFVDTASGYQFITSGKLRPIGVASAKRVKNFETIPTLNEQGLKNFEAYAWQGLVVPAGTPVEAINTLNKALLTALNTTEIKARLQVLGLEAIPSSPKQMAEYTAKERAKWAPIIKSSNIKAD
jgi:tripartite-type tricarboxylate transporter receptor subunit TctC